MKKLIIGEYKNWSMFIHLLQQQSFNLKEIKMKFLNVELLTVDVRVAIMKLRYKFADAENLMQQ